MNYFSNLKCKDILVKYFVTIFASGFDEWDIFMLGLYHYFNGEYTFFQQSRPQKLILLASCYVLAEVHSYFSKLEGQLSDNYLDIKYIIYFIYIEYCARERIRLIERKFDLVYNIIDDIQHYLFVKTNRYLAISISNKTSKQRRTKIIIFFANVVRLCAYTI